MARTQTDRQERQAHDRDHAQFARRQRTLERRAFFLWLNSETERLGRKLTAEEIAAFERGQR